MLTIYFQPGDLHHFTDKILEVTCRDLYSTNLLSVCYCITLRVNGKTEFLFLPPTIIVYSICDNRVKFQRVTGIKLISEEKKQKQCLDNL